MKTYLLFHQRNQELFETGNCVQYKDIPQFKKVVVLTKNKKSLTEEGLLLKLSLLQLLFNKKAFILIDKKTHKTSRKLPIGGFLNIKKHSDYFLDYFFSTFLESYNKFFFSNNYIFRFKIIFKRKSFLMKHYFKYSLYS